MSTTNKVPFVDLVSQHTFLDREIKEAISTVLARGSFTLGEVAKNFESEFAAYCNVEYAVGVGSGTDALHFALRALGVGSGDEVITVPNSFVATIEAIAMCGAKPVFVDIESDSYLMDVVKLERAITKRTKAIVPVHLYGQLANMEEICRIAAAYDLRVVEDACQAHGASQDGIRAGRFGDVACFSFYPSKNLGGIGDGGIAVTNNKEVSEHIARLRNHGEAHKYEHVEMGYCSRLHGLQAAVLSVKLKYLDRWNKARRYNAGLYDQHLKDARIAIPLAVDGNEHIYHLYVVRSDDREGLQQHLTSANIDSGIHYPIPLHLLPWVKRYGYRSGDFPIAEKAANEILSLPMYPELREADIERVAAEVVGFTTRGSKKAA